MSPPSTPATIGASRSRVLPKPLPPGVEFFSGAGGLTGSAEDYLQFCQMLLNGGQWNGARLLSRKSVELMTDNAIGNLDLANYPVQGQNLSGYGFGLGVRVRKSTGASGWLGSVGDYGWARRKRNVFLDRSERTAHRHGADGDHRGTPADRISERGISGHHRLAASTAAISS